MVDKIALCNPNEPEQTAFWRHSISWAGSATPRVLRGLIVSTIFAIGISFIYELAPWPKIGIGPIEASGAVLGLLLVFRFNTGYDRWWEARKIWGGIVNQSRNLVLSGLAYGPHESKWQNQFARWSAAFCHSARISLRGEKGVSVDLSRLIGTESATAAATADHLPSFVAFNLARLLRDAKDTHSMDGFAFIQVDRERAKLIDHIGACERILRTPVPQVAAIKVRRFIAAFLIALPVALVGRVGWYTPLVMVFVTYPLLSLDLIGAELQNPFFRSSLSHLPLDEICATIERNLLFDHFAQNDKN